VLLKKILGLDEAGRGPILGPLVMAGVVLDELGERNLVKLGVKDSKFVSSDKREELFPEIVGRAVAYKIVVLEPKVIDAALQDSNSNLNWLEAKTSATIINELEADTAIIDCPSVNIPAYDSYTRKLVVRNMKLVFEHKAEKYVPVAAASILAKVTRDRIVAELKSKIGVDFGSGYMSDEKTQKFLEKYHEEHSSLFRKMWLPYQAQVEKKMQKKLGEF
jgi:ribonuclease HII